MICTLLVINGIERLIRVELSYESAFECEIGLLSTIVHAGMLWMSFIDYSSRRFMYLSALQYINLAMISLYTVIVFKHADQHNLMQERDDPF